MTLVEVSANPLNVDEARGRALRKTVPRRSLAQLTPSAQTATEILVAQNAERLSELVPLRFARMLDNPLHVLLRFGGGHGRRPGRQPIEWNRDHVLR